MVVAVVLLLLLLLLFVVVVAKVEEDSIVAVVFDVNVVVVANDVVEMTPILLHGKSFICWFLLIITTKKGMWKFKIKIPYQTIQDISIEKQNENIWKKNKQ